MKHFAWLVLVLFAACPQKRAVVIPDRHPVAVGRFHVVEAGDTVTSIAERYGVSAADIVEVNGIADADSIIIGQRLFLPEGEPSEPNVASATQPTPAAIPPAYNGVFAWPLNDGVMVREFSKKKNYDGILLVAPGGTKVFAAAAGDVAYVGNGGALLGQLVIVRHDDKMTTLYGHIEHPSVTVGERVDRGSVIAEVGESGGAESPRLFFQIREGRTPIDPLQRLPPP